MATQNIPNNGDWRRGPDGHIAAKLTPQPWIITKELPPDYWLATKCKIGRTASGSAPEAVSVIEEGAAGNTRFVKIQIGWLRPDLERYKASQKMYQEISFWPGMDNKIVRGTKTPNGQDERNWTVLAQGQAAFIQTTGSFTKQFFKFKSSVPKGASESTAWQTAGESPKEFQAVYDGNGGVNWATL